MRVVIAGSRGIEDYGLVVEAVELATMIEGIEPTVVLSGAARGVDRLGEQFAKDRGLVLEQYPAAWKEYPRMAGRMRNVQMGRRCDALIAVWDGVSPGTKHMIEWCRKNKKPVYVHQPCLSPF